MKAKLLAAIAIGLFLPAIALADDSVTLRPHQAQRWEVGYTDFQHSQRITITYLVASERCEETPLLLCQMLQYKASGNWEPITSQVGRECTQNTPVVDGTYLLKVENLSTCTLKVFLAVK